MFKSVVLLCVAFCVVIEARPKWQFLPAVPGYVPVYIQSGDTPLEQINPELAEAFHALPAGRSASKQIDASPEEMADQPREDIPVSEDQPREDIPVSEDQPAEEIPILVDQPRERVSDSDDQPKEDVSVSEDQPREEVSVSEDQPREEVSVLVDQPREDVSVSNEQSREDVSVSEDQPREDVSASVDHRPYAKKLLEKKKKVNLEVAKPIERR